MLVAAVKSRVHGSTNLSILMYQQQMLHLASMFGWIPGDDESPQFLHQLQDDDCEEPSNQISNNLLRKKDIPGAHHQFLTPRKRKRLLEPELRHLKKHYITRYSRSKFSACKGEIQRYGKVWNCLGSMLRHVL
jgi:hypothetical protein